MVDVTLFLHFSNYTKSLIIGMVSFPKKRLNKRKIFQVIDYCGLENYGITRIYTLVKKSQLIKY